jgi:hypothetical protein
MTVDELGERMTSEEFTRWQAFYAYRRAMQEKAVREENVKAKARRGKG